MIANNVTRLLQSRKIPHQVFELSNEKRGAIETADILGVPPEVVYKTIVVIPEAAGKKPLLCVIPGPNEVDLRLAAASVGEKKVRLASQDEAEKITGLKTGSISALALTNRGFRIILDEAALQHADIHVSGGQRNLNIRLPVKAYLELTHPLIAKIAKEP